MKALVYKRILVESTGLYLTRQYSIAARKDRAMRLPTQFKQTKRSVIAFLLAIASFSAIAQIDNLAEAQRLLKQGQHTQALGQADTYILAKPRDPQGRFVKGLILAEMRRNPEAIAVFKKLTEDFPELPEPYNNLAVLYAQDKQFERARTALEAAIKTHPSYSVAHENLGDVYAKLASQAYGKALQIDSGNPATQSKLALIRDLITTSAKSNGKAVEPIKSNTNSKLAASEMAKPIPAPPTSTPPPVQTALPAPPIATVATSAPAKAVESPAAVSNTANSEAIKAVQSWANAWEQKDYLNRHAYQEHRETVIPQHDQGRGSGWLDNFRNRAYRS